MPPLSVVIIARNEEDRIAEAIASVSFADEVVVLDSGSTDATPALARSLGAKVVETDWPGHVAQKNRALSHAAHTWVLSIDADERVSPALAASIQTLMARAPAADGYEMSRLSWWMGAPVRHGTWYPDRRVRLFRRDRAAWTGIDPHDIVAVEGAVERISGDIIHHPYRSLSDHLSTIDRYTARHVEVARQRGVTAGWWDVVLRPPLHFVKAYLLKRGFLDGMRGWCIAGLGATYVLVKWTRLYLHREES
ncbi:MAG: glycosyltransferase involved in cell wall biosynthesis [Myxococcota bacterium]|jgi:glycosyltransferase involved in cell wall biosynthesis